MGDERFGSGELIDGRFRLEQELGSGGFGSVWAAVDETTGETVAVKILREELAEHPFALDRFLREIAVLRDLEHPNIARAIAGGSDARCHYLAMQFVEGRTLLADMVDVATRGARYSPAEICAVASGLAAALDFSHARGVVHRDLKPANVMIRRIDDRLVPTILDFGIAKITVELADQTTLGRRLGTLMYMSPEALRGEAIDGRTDVFSMAVILFEMLTLRRPFARNDLDQPAHLTDNGSSQLNTHALVMKRIAAEARPKPSTFREGLDASADAVLLRALDHSPKNRFTTPGSLAAALEASLAEREAPIEPTAVAPTKLLPPPKRSLTAPLVVAIFALVTVAVAAIVVERAQPEELHVEAQKIEEHTTPIVLPRPPPPPEPADPVPPEVPSPPPAKVRTPPPPPPPKVEAPVRDPAIDAMRSQLAATDDGPGVVRIAHALESQAARLSDRDARISIERCATLSALRAEKRELSRCLDAFERALAAP